MFQQVANFRDLGGYQTHGGQRIRKRRLYRSASLDWMTREDARFARHELRLRTVIDLRAAHEVSTHEGHPLFAGGDRGVTRLHAPLSNPIVEAGWTAVPLFGVESYVLSLQHAREAIREAFERLAAPDALPALIHCTEGKNRTGILIALVLELLGVSDDDIEADYRASKAHLSRAIEVAGGDPARAPSALLEVYPAALRGTLEWVRETFGGAEAYLLVCGVDDATIRCLREALLE